EAERGTFDPTYLVYTVGKLMMLKLRQDCRQLQGKAFSLRNFHDTLLGHGTDLAAPEPHARRRRGRSARLALWVDMPLYEYECEACGHRVERIQKFSD